ncbi:MAG: cation diffusion facilitator family transporter [Sphingomonadales bacterium]|nr:cation diffusion facilitator family transporter [Sphingomonadales bacterium]
MSGRHTTAPAPEDAGPLMRLATMAAVGVAALLIVTKAVAWLMTGSVALLGSLVDSVLDLVASAVNFFAVRAALAPADKAHRFGHGKAEAIAGLFQSAIIFGSAAFLLLEAIERLINPQPISAEWVGIGVSVFAIVMTGFLVAYQMHVIRRTGSVAVSADHLHYKGDLLLNGSVIASIAITAFSGFLYADALFGILIAGYIAFNATGILKQSLDMLMDREFSEADRDRIFDLVLGNAQVRGLHDLKTRKSGITSFIQLHIELDPELNLRAAHFIADEVEATLGEAFPSADILIHVDPLGVEEPNKTMEEVVGGPKAAGR